MGVGGSKFCLCSNFLPLLLQSKTVDSASCPSNKIKWGPAATTNVHLRDSTTAEEKKKIAQAKIYRNNTNITNRGFHTAL